MGSEGSTLPLLALAARAPVVFVNKLTAKLKFIFGREKEVIKALEK
jgi:hypothetical protein